jgi:hypothetical protein
MHKTDYLELENMIQNEEYEISFNTNRIFMTFNKHDYSERYLTIEKDFEQGRNNVIVETGYYFN